MTKNEVVKLLMTIQTFYPNYQVENKEFTINAWYSIIGDCDYKPMEKALRAYITTDTSGFAPSIGQLIDNIYSTEEIAFEQSEYKIWGNVMKAVSNSLYNASVEFSKLDEISQTVLGSPESLRTMAMDSDFNENVSKALFMKSYRNEVERRKRLKRMPEDVKKKLGISNKIGGCIE